jgi:hypothetical protein
MKFPKQGKILFLSDFEHLEFPEGSIAFARVLEGEHKMEQTNYG